MAVPLSPFGRRGIPAPFLITPQTEEEAVTGVATLLSAGDIAGVLQSLYASNASPCLIAKFTKLRTESLSR